MTFCACLWVDIFAFCSKEIKHCMKALHGHQLDICRFSEMYRCGLPQWGIAASLWRAVYSFGKRQAYLWIPTEPLWLTTQLDAIQSQYWGLCLVTRDGQLDPLYIYCSFQFSASWYSWVFKQVCLSFLCLLLWTFPSLG